VAAPMAVGVRIIRRGAAVSQDVARLSLS
jgi:hypothetical protein